MGGHITSRELAKAVEDIKEHVDLKVRPIVKDVLDHDTILRGASKKNGLVGDVNSIKTTHKHVKWAVAGGLSGLIAFVKSLF